MSEIHQHLKRPISFYRSFVGLGAGVTGALFLSQAAHFSASSIRADGWFVMTGQAWQRLTGLTRSEQETARRHLREIGVLQEARKGLPAKTHYRVDFARLQELRVSDAQGEIAYRNPKEAQ